MYRLLLVAMIFLSMGAATAQETDDNLQVNSDLAVDAEYLDLDENIINTASVGDEVFEGVAVTNLGPTNATGVKVDIARSSQYPFEYLEHEVSWDNGATWLYNDPSYDPLTSRWTIGNLPVGAVYRLVVHQRATAPGTAQFTATITGDQPDLNVTNNNDTATITIKESQGAPEAEAGKVPMQDTGAGAGLLVLGIGILGTGMVISRR
jgi:hypothetical protein